MSETQEAFAKLLEDADSELQRRFMKTLIEMHGDKAVDEIALIAAWFVLNVNDDCLAALAEWSAQGGMEALNQ